MKMPKTIGVVAAGLALAAGWTSTAPFHEDVKLDMNYKTRAVVERMADDDITLDGGGNAAKIKKERKLNIAVYVDPSFQMQDKAAPLDNAKLITSAQAIARSYLHNVRGYKLEALGEADFARVMKTGADLNGVVYPFLAKLKPILSSEVNRKMKSEEIMYRCQLQWELIDNRTQSNGLGDLQVPEVKQSLTCQSFTTRERMALLGVNPDAKGSDLANAQNAYNEVLGHVMVKFYGQLANLIPFGGCLRSIKTLDGNMTCTMKVGKDHGIIKKMQMLIFNEDGDRIAVGEVMVSTDTKCNIKIWRWLSPSYRKEIESVVAKGKDAVEAWLDENPLLAQCLGLPELEDLQTDFSVRSIRNKAR